MKDGQQKKDDLREAIAEARRFLDRAQRWQASLVSHFHVIYGSKHAAAAKRASMDLTRALAELRRS